MKFNFRLEDLLYLITFGFFGVLGGTAKYLTDNKAKDCDMRQYAKVVVVSAISSIAICFAILESTQSTGFLVSAGILGGYLGSQLLDMGAEWILDKIQKTLFGGNNDNNND